MSKVDMDTRSNHFKYYNCDDRAEFANLIFKNLYRLYKGDFNNTLFLSESAKIVDHLEEYVRNIYEVIDDEIPMMAYINVLRDGHSGYCEWEEYSSQADALKVIESYCHKFYS